MIIVCENSYYKFYPEGSGAITRFGDIYGIQLKQEHDYYTFPKLIDLPLLSVRGQLYGDTPAIETFYSTNKGDVLKANKIVFNLNLQILTPIARIVSQFEIIGDDKKMVISGLLQAGASPAKMQSTKISSYTGFFDIKNNRTYIEGLAAYDI